MTTNVRGPSAARFAEADWPEDRPPTSAPPRVAVDLRRIPDAPHYVAALARITEPSETEAARQGRLDAFRDAFSGPYVVDGQSVLARPMFRMNGGFNDASQQAHAAELRAIARAANVPWQAIANAMAGRPTPEDLCRLTQALIHAGKLANDGQPADVRVRRMQWEWGIGVDCAGYTEQAARAARGEKPKAPTHGDAFSGLAHDKTMQKIDVAHVRAGDVVHLSPGSGDTVGHNVVVYGRRALNADAIAEYTSKGPLVAAFFSGKGPFHEVAVDSSWGAGPNGAEYGGFRRDTWVYDGSASTWLCRDAATEAYATSNVGPHDHPYGGAFRPQSARATDTTSGTRGTSV